MEELSRHPDAFIRPSPSGGTLGGVAARTREAMLACEAAGFDVIIVETVGVGQSETAVAGMTDVFVLLQLPNAGRRPAGDQARHRRARRHHRLQQDRPRPQGGQPRDGADEKRAHAAAPGRGRLASAGARHQRDAAARASTRSGARSCAAATRSRRRAQLAAKRRRQSLDWMWTLIDAGLRERFRAHPGVRAALPACSAQVADGTLTPTAAASLLLDTTGTENAPCMKSSVNSTKSARARARAAARSASPPSTPRASCPRASASSCCSTKARSRNGTCSSSTAAPTSAWPRSRCPATVW